MEATITTGPPPPSGVDQPVRKVKRRIRKQFFVCDVCRIQKFDTLDAAIRHEKECRKLQLQKQQQQQDETAFAIQSSSQDATSVIVIQDDDKQEEEDDNDNVVQVVSQPTNPTRRKRKSDSPESLLLLQQVSPCSNASNPSNNNNSHNKGEEEEEEVVVLLEKQPPSLSSSSSSQCLEPTTQEPASSSKAAIGAGSGGNWLLAASHKMKTKAASTKQQSKARTKRETGGSRKAASQKQPPSSAKPLGARDDRQNKKPRHSSSSNNHNNDKKKNPPSATTTTTSTVEEDLSAVLQALGKHGTSHDALLAEQRAAERQAQRRRQQQQQQVERKRPHPSQRRSVVDTTQPAKQGDTAMNPFLVMSSSSSSSNNNKRAPKQVSSSNNDTFAILAALKNGGPQKTTKPAGSKKRQIPAAPRFPNPTHVLPSDSHNEHVIVLDESCCLEKWGRSNEPVSSPVPMVDPTKKVALLPISSAKESTDSRRPMAAVDPVATIMTRLLASANHKPRRIPLKSGQVLAEQYRISSAELEDPDTGIVCETLRQGAKELLEFIEAWKAERHRANQRMAERQKRLLQSSKPKRIKKRGNNKRKANIDDDDDWWMEGNRREDDDSVLRNLMLVTGPIASGKTSLVHAVTKQCDCQLLELNTSDTRSGAKIKQLLEEATQSHSSVDLLKKKKQQLQTLWSKEEEKEEELVDSEDEEDAEEPVGKDSLTVILIDEVDLLYEQDTGFWSALADLTKSRKAKCPIVLTSHSVPDKLKSFRYNHIELERPTLDESVLRMQHILRKEGLEEQAVHVSLLKACATLLGRDMRRFCNQLQSFLERVADAGRDRQDEPPPVAGLLTHEPPRLVSPLPANVPSTSVVVQSVKPDHVPFHEYSLLTLQGSGFLSLVPSSSSQSCQRSHGVGYKVQVHIHGRLAPDACVLDDETLLVVYAPCCDRPSESNTPKLFEDDVDQEDREIVPLVLSSVDKRGVLSTTEGSLAMEQFGDGTRVVSTTKPLVVEIRFPPQAATNRGQPTQQESNEIVANLMQEGVDAWKSRNPDPVVPSQEMAADERGMDVADMEQAAYRARLASDAAWFESGWNQSFPVLAGSCRGFGLEMTDAVHLRTSDKSEL